MLIDCAPSTSVLTAIALVAADAFIVPVGPTYLALAGVVGLGEVVANVREGVGEVAPVLGIVVTQVGDEEDGHPPAMQDAVIDVLRRQYGVKVFHSLLHYDQSLQQTPAHSEDIV